MKIMYSPYSLQYKEEFSAKYKSSQGVLLRFEDKDVQSYSLYHPIESLGDIGVKEFLKSPDFYVFENGRLNRVFDLAVNGLDQPALDILCYEHCTKFSQAEESVSDVVKMKISNINEIINGISNSSKKSYIFDANAQWTVKDCEKISDQKWLGAIKYLEDPVLEENFISSLPVASDFISYNKYDYKVIKPTGFNHKIENPLNKPLVVTSYLDHPLGQIISAIYAHKNNVTEACGLMTHTIFEKNKYSELFSNSGNFKFGAYDELVRLLEKEEWKSLK